MPAVPMGAGRPAARAAWPWLVPVVGLLLTVAALWLKAAADRTPAPESSATQPDGPVGHDGKGSPDDIDNPQAIAPAGLTARRAAARSGRGRHSGPRRSRGG